MGRVFHRTELSRRLIFQMLGWMCLFFIGLGACLPLPCTRDALEVTYEYTTSCRSVALKSSGELSLRLAQEAISESEHSDKLATQVRALGLYAREFLLSWEKASCVEDKTRSLKILGIERIVLEPGPDDVSSVQILLVCTPTTKQPAGGLKSDFLFACRKGAQIQTFCTLGFTLKS